MSRRSTDERERSGFADDTSPDATENAPAWPARLPPERLSQQGRSAPAPVQPERRYDPDVERPYYLRDDVYVLRESEFATLTQTGKFRVVDVTDLLQFHYAGDTQRMARDIRRLELQGLLARHRLGHEPKRTQRLVTLTKKAKRLLLASGRISESQSLYHGIVKPRELKHDSALYRLYQQEAKRIAQAGGRPVRVLLDFELKRRVQRDLAVPPETRDDHEARRRIAERHGLVLVAGKIQIPDLRVEYETAEHRLAQTDLELATRNYRPGALSQKAKAGFSLYAAGEDAGKLRRVLEDCKLTAKIHAL
jgi:hypothetical protein